MGSTLLVTWGAGATKWRSRPSEPPPGLGRPPRPYFIFSNRETWVGGGGDSVRDSCKPTKPGWARLGSWTLVHKRRRPEPRGRRSGQAALGRPTPAAAPLPGRGSEPPSPAAGRGGQPRRPAPGLRVLEPAAAPSPGDALPSPPLPRPRPAEGAAGVPRGPHQAELANFVVGHKAEDVLDGYDGQRHQRVVLRQLVGSQRRGWGRLGARLRGRGRGREGQSLGRADGRRGAAVAVAAASFLSHPLLRRRRHLGGLIPSPHSKGIRGASGASLPPRAAGRGPRRGGACAVVRGGIS